MSFKSYRMRISVVPFIFLMWLCGVLLASPLYVINPYRHVDNNSYLLQVMNRYVVHQWTDSFLSETVMVSFFTFVSHEMGHLRASLSHGDIYSPFPHIIKSVSYIPTNEQYLEETIAGPNQQEQNAFIQWSSMSGNPDRYESYGFLLNKLTDLGYLLLTTGTQYWDRGYSAPYESYNVFGDHNFYLKLLENKGVVLSRTGLLLDMLFTDIASLAVWDHFGYWWNQSFGDQKALYRPSIIEVGEHRFRAPYLEYFLTPEGGFVLGYLQSVYSEVDGEFIRFSMGGGLRLFNSSKVPITQVGVRVPVLYGEYLKSYASVGISVKEGALDVDGMSVDLGLELIITSDMRGLIRMIYNDNDYVESTVKGNARYLRVELGLDWGI
jgi:hypothetical protein